MIVRSDYGATRGTLSTIWQLEVSSLAVSHVIPKVLKHDVRILPWSGPYNTKDINSSRAIFGKNETLNNKMDLGVLVV